MLWKLGAVAVLVAAFATLGWLLREAWHAEAIARSSAESYRSANAQLLNERAAADAALLKREREIQVINRNLGHWRARVRDLEVSNAELRNWRDVLLPAAVLELLRELTAARGSDEGVPATVVVGALPGIALHGQDERGPTGLVSGERGSPEEVQR